MSNSTDSANMQISKASRLFWRHGDYSLSNTSKPYDYFKLNFHHLVPFTFICKKSHSFCYHVEQPATTYQVTTVATPGYQQPPFPQGQGYPRNKPL